jgi:hypothetical protein
MKFLLGLQNKRRSFSLLCCIKQRMCVYSRGREQFILFEVGTEFINLIYGSLFLFSSVSEFVDRLEQRVMV